MKRLIFCLVVVTVWLIHLTSSSALSAQDRRTALVIGNGAYKSAPLRNPVNDASDIADVLERLGFSVSLKTDANQRNMKQAIRAFGKQLQKGGVGLFYFAGPEKDMQWSEAREWVQSIDIPLSCIKNMTKRYLKQ